MYLPKVRPTRLFIPPPLTNCDFTYVNFPPILCDLGDLCQLSFLVRCRPADRQWKPRFKPDVCARQSERSAHSPIPSRPRQHHSGSVTLNRPTAPAPTISDPALLRILTAAQTPRAHAPQPEQTTGLLPRKHGGSTSQMKSRESRSDSAD